MKMPSGVLVGAAMPVVGAALLRHRMGKTVAKLNQASSAADSRLDVPTEVQHVNMHTSDGGSIHYIDTKPDGLASDPTIVLCHGISGQWWVWSAVIHSMRAYYRVIAWDMRGHGKSIAGTDGVSIAAAARDLAELLESLDLHQAIVVGHSMGGMELGRFLVDHTKCATARLKGGLFLATTANAMTGSIRSGGWARNTKTLNKVSALSGEKQVKWGADNRLGLTLMASAFGPGVTRRMVDDQVRLQNEFPVGSSRQGSVSIAEHNVEAALRKRADELGGIRFAVVSGTHDRLTPPIHGRGIVNSLPHASWTELSGAGHNIMVEDPDAVVEAINSLLAER